MDNKKSIEKSTIFLNIYKYLFDITSFSVEFTWGTFEKIIDEMIEILQNSIQSNMQIGSDPLLEHVMEEISKLVPKWEFSPAQWKQKRINEKYQKLCNIYDEVKIPVLKEEQNKINNIDDYFKSKKFIQISSIGKYLNAKPLDLKYYETFLVFLKDITKLIWNKNNSCYQIRQIYVLCKEIISDIPNILITNEVDTTNFYYLLSLCDYFLKHSVNNVGGFEQIKYQTARMIKLDRINRYLDRPYISR